MFFHILYQGVVSYDNQRQYALLDVNVLIRLFATPEINNETTKARGDEAVREPLLTL